MSLAMVLSLTACASRSSKSSSQSYPAGQSPGSSAPAGTIVTPARPKSGRISLVNTSALGGQERIGLYTTFLSDGSLFYYLTVVPEGDARVFDEAFRRIGQSIKLTDAR